MNRFQRALLRLRGHNCFSCHYCEVFRSNGDGQVSRVHAFCRNPASPYADRPIPPERWCDAWQQAPPQPPGQAPDDRRPQPDEIERLTA